MKPTEAASRDQPRSNLHAAILGAYCKLNAPPFVPYPDFEDTALVMVAALAQRATDVSGHPEEMRQILGCESGWGHMLAAARKSVAVEAEFEKVPEAIIKTMQAFGMPTPMPLSNAVHRVEILLAALEHQLGKRFSGLEQRAQNFADERDQARAIEEQAQQSLNKLEREFAELESTVEQLQEDIDERNALVVHLMLGKQS